MGDNSSDIKFNSGTASSSALGSGDLDCDEGYGTIESYTIVDNMFNVHPVMTVIATSLNTFNPASNVVKASGRTWRALSMNCFAATGGYKYSLYCVPKGVIDAVVPAASVNGLGLPADVEGKYDLPFISCLQNINVASALMQYRAQQYENVGAWTPMNNIFLYMTGFGSEGNSLIAKYYSQLWGSWGDFRGADISSAGVDVTYTNRGLLNKYIGLASFPNRPRTFKQHQSTYFNRVVTFKTNYPLDVFRTYTMSVGNKNVTPESYLLYKRVWSPKRPPNFTHFFGAV